MEVLTPMDSYTACSIIEGFCIFTPTREQELGAWATLIRNGDCWQLQGFYGRTASRLIDNGIISTDGQILADIDDYEG
jgi:hypothetical protein